MPSLRKRVSTYFRQLSFHNEPRQKRNNVNENAFVTKYLQGHISLREGPPIIHGKNPTDLPNYELAKYETGYESIVSCYSGPHGGLTTIRRREKHLSIPDADDFDFIDTQQEEAVQPTLPKKSPKRTPGQPVDNTKMVIKVAGQEYFVKNDTKKHKKSQSLGSISDFNIEIEKTKIDKEFYRETNENKNGNHNNNNNNEIIESKNANKEESIRISLDESSELNEQSMKDNLEDKKIENGRNSRGENRRNQHRHSSKPDKDHVVRYRPPKSQKSGATSRNESQVTRQNSQCKSTKKNYGLVKSKSEGNPFRHKGAKKSVDRPNCGGEHNQSNPIPTVVIDDSNLPHEWNKKTDFVFGISDSLYDTNLVTKIKNGDPIADCFGVIARHDSMILAVADGVNWGEKACIAAKSAIHGCLHYLNKTIFNDTKLFENLIILSDQTTCPTNSEPITRISNTREVFICLLRAFNCAHDLILENNGMLTTLTVAVVLPLSGRDRRAGQGRGFDRGEEEYVCCVCNVGDTLAYIYSSEYGLRELTKGSHDVNSNRDMRDALGALGPVDGINPELSNLTLSVTTLNKGDIVMVASDGLTDNFDPNVCKFTVNTTTKINPINNRGTSRRAQPNSVERQQVAGGGIALPAPSHPVKPPRRSHLKKEDRAGSVDSRDSKKSEDSGSTSKSAENDEVHLDAAVVESVGKDLKSQNETRVEEDALMDNPLVAHFMRQNSVDDSPKKTEQSNKKALDKKPPSVVENKTSSLRRQALTQKGHDLPSTSQDCRNTQGKLPSNQRPQQAHSFLRSKTTIDFHSTNKKPILRNEEGIPYVTPLQRYELQLLLMEDVLKHGISGEEPPCTISRKLCENLVNFTFSITAAKRRTLEDMDLYFDNRDGVLVEVSPMEKKQRRKKGLERVLNLPGKLDHVTVVACNVGHIPIVV